MDQETGGRSGLLLAHLSTESRRRLAELFRDSVENGEEGEGNLIPALLQLQSLDCDELDTYADQPIVAVSPVQTANALTAELRKFLDDWRNRFGLSKQRIRTDKFDKYLAVWDARERWTGSDYELKDDCSLVDVARLLHLPPGTARNQYQTAFELITGHSYSTATWIRIFGTRKYPPDLMSDINGAVMRRRLQPRGSRPPVPESVLNPNANRSSFLAQSPSAANHDIALWEMIEDVRTLSGAGRTDTEIAQHLEISQDVVALLKQRIDNE